MARNNYLYLTKFSLYYFPYGKVLREFVNGEKERYLTTQHERDQTTGLDYRGARYYDSDVARFLSLDPLAQEFPAWNPYSYVLGDPIALTDPNGEGPGDLFKTTDAAANDWGQTYGEKSIIKNREYGSVIYVVEKNGETFYTYKRAKKGSKDATSLRKNPRKTVAVADIHSHGAYDSSSDNSNGTEPLDIGDEYIPIEPGVDPNNTFSSTDKVGNMIDDKRNGYLVSPDGRLQLLDWKTGEIDTVDTNLPRDPEIDKQKP